MTRITRLPQELTDSGWFASLDDVPPPRTPPDTVRCDWLVVGGGWMGLHAAQRLAELRPGERIVLIDAGRIGNSAAGRSAGFAIDLAHNPRRKDFAEDTEGNREETAVNREGIAYMRACRDRYGIACDWSDEGKIHAAASAHGHRHLQTLDEALEWIGEPREWYDRDTMQAITGTSYYRQGLFTPGTHLLQPAAYLRGLANALAGQIEVYENNPVTEVRHGSSGHTCTVGDAKIEARNLVLTTNGYLSGFGFFSEHVIPVYTYASLTRPLTDEELGRIPGRATFGVIPADPFGTTLRRTVDRRIFIRNIYDYAPGFHISPARLAHAQSRHQRSFTARYPQIAEIGFEHTWGGCLCLAQNGGMVFGEIGARVFAAAFCNGTGIARGAAFGKALAELATGRDSPTIDILQRRPAPTRTLPRPLLKLGVGLTTRYRLWRAGAET